MYGRPDSVAAIGYLLTIGGALGLLVAIFSLGYSDLPSYLMPDNMMMGIAIDGVASVFSIVCGFNILKGANWARWLYTGVCAALLVWDLLFLLDKFYTLVPATIIRTLTIIFLFLPGANKFFRRRSRR